MKKGNFRLPLYNEFLPRSPVIKLLAESQLENEEDVTIFSSMNDEIGFEKYLKRTTRSLKISDAFKISDTTISDVFNFGKNYVQN